MRRRLLHEEIHNDHQTERNTNTKTSVRKENVYRRILTLRVDRLDSRVNRLHIHRVTLNFKIYIY